MAESRIYLFLLKDNEMYFYVSSFFSVITREKPVSSLKKTKVPGFYLSSRVAVGRSEM